MIVVSRRTHRYRTATSTAAPGCTIGRPSRVCGTAAPGCGLSRLATAFLTAAALLADASAQPAGPASRPDAAASDAAPRKKGLVLNEDAAFAGYTLFAPLNSTTTYLVDMKGQVAHSWPSKYVPGQAAYLLPDGTLLRAAREPGDRNFGGGGIGGRVERLAPDGTVLWEYVCADEKRHLHHDIEPLPNGNVLVIAWEKKTRDEAIAAGRDPELAEGDELWPDCVIEVEPQGASGGRIVWEWHLWDHLVQDTDENKPNYGVVADHPELVDLNYRHSAPRESPAEMQRLRALGYVGGGDDPPPAGQDGPPDRDGPPPGRDADDSPPHDAGGPPFRGRGPGGFDMRADLCHTNAIAYNARLDQIVLSVHEFNEIWVIDHSTTTAEAASHAGGRSGKGGDLLFRWGNPRAYGAGSAADQQLFAQHDARWIPAGCPGAGRIMVFNNGMGRREGRYSSVVEIEPPIEASGRYRRETGQPFGPPRPSWQYVAENKSDFFASHISGAHRLANGNTLICDGEQGRLFEVTNEGRVVWEYFNPYQDARPPRDGPPPGFGPFGPPDRPRVARRPGSADGPPTSRPVDPSDRPRHRPPFGGPPGPWGPRGGGPGGPGGVFRATRLAADDPGILKLLGTR